MSEKQQHVNGRMERPAARSKSNLDAIICGVAGIAFSAMGTTAAVAADSPSAMPISGITVDAQRQLVVKFDNHTGGFPTVPHLLDLPGPDHRVVVDFGGAVIEKGAVQAQEELSAAVVKVLPACKSVRYSNLANAPKPTARIVIDLPEGLHADPRVVKLEEGMVTIDLGDEVASAQSSSEPVAAAPATGPVETAAANDSANQPGASAPASETTNSTADAANAPSATVPAVATTPATNSDVPAVATKTAGSWDWGANGSSSANAAPQTSPATAQAQAAPSADSVDGEAPGAPAVPVAAQPAGNSTPELRPAIDQKDAASANAAPVASAASSESSDTPMSSLPAATATTAAPQTPAATQTGAKAALRLYNSAVKNHLSGKLAEAIADYKGAIAANPQFGEAHSNLGLIYNQQHNYVGAISEFRKALAINPKDAITYNGIGAALRAQHDLVGAIKNWQTAVELDPRLATAHYNLGTAYELQRDYDRALESYKEAVRNDYRLGEAYYRMGLILARKHETEDAVSQFKEALKVSGDAEYAEDARRQLAALSKTTASAGSTK